MFNWKKFLTLFGIVTLLAFLLLVGCRLRIVVPEEGKVITRSGNFDCKSGRKCVIKVNNTDFDEVFIGVPNQGYRFSHWKKKTNGLCGGKDRPCALSTASLLDNGTLMSILDSDIVFSLTPVFAHEYTSRLSAGNVNSCAIDNNGVRCWGRLGQSAVPPHMINPFHVDADTHVCVLFGSTPRIRCWGYDEFGETRIPNDIVNPSFVSAGDRYTCVIHYLGVRCWGRDVQGISNVPPLVNPRHVDSDIHSCAIDDNGVVCWGSESNYWGQEDVPNGLVNPRQVAVSGHSSCVLDDNGVHCWGQVLTDPPFKPVNPIRMVIGTQFGCVLDDSGVRCWGSLPGGDPSALSNPRDITAAAQHWCALDDSGVQCWGANFAGQSNVPKALINPLEVSAGPDYTCAIDDSVVRCWGNNQSNQAPAQIAYVEPRAISTSVYHSCFIHLLGIHCSGANNFGQLNAPDDLIDPIEVATGLWHTCAIDKNGVHCWGGHPWFANEVPIDLRDPFSLVASGYNTCVLDNGFVRCWGPDEDIAPDRKFLNPQQITLGWGGLCVLYDGQIECTENQNEIPDNLINPVMISAGSNHACAIDDEGLKCWGENDKGQTSVPDNLENPRQVTAGDSHTCVLDDAGVRCWGSGPATEVPTDLKF